MSLAQGRNAVPLLRLKPATLDVVTHSTTKQPHP